VKQLTAQQEREYVEARWINVRNDGTLKHPIPVLNEVEVKIPFAEWDAGWHAAYLYTKERERRIAEVTYELSLMNLISSNHENAEWKNPHDHRADGDALLRVIVRIEAALADLKRGLR